MFFCLCYCVIRNELSLRFEVKLCFFFFFIENVISLSIDIFLLVVFFLYLVFVVRIVLIFLMFLLVYLILCILVYSVGKSILFLFKGIVKIFVFFVNKVGSIVMILSVFVYGVIWNKIFCLSVLMIMSIEYFVSMDNVLVFVIIWIVVCERGVMEFFLVFCNFL